MRRLNRRLARIPLVTAGTLVLAGAAVLSASMSASASPSARRIHDIQGAAHRSPLVGRTVEQVPGVVTAVSATGFWMQDPHPDSNPATSEGIFVDVAAAHDLPRGFWGVGSIHHLAWRVDDEAHQLAVRKQVEAAARRPTPVIDRFWFKSVYFKEPGGVLFEIATAGPGFAADEDPDHLGEALVLPPWLEPHRSAIEQALPPLTDARHAEPVRPEAP